MSVTVLLAKLKLARTILSVIASILIMFPDMAETVRKMIEQIRLMMAELGNRNPDMIIVSEDELKAASFDDDDISEPGAGLMVHPAFDPLRLFQSFAPLNLGLLDFSGCEHIWGGSFTVGGSDGGVKYRVKDGSLADKRFLHVYDADVAEIGKIAEGQPPKGFLAGAADKLKGKWTSLEYAASLGGAETGKVVLHKRAPIADKASALAAQAAALVGRAVAGEEPQCEFDYGGWALQGSFSGPSCKIVDGTEEIALLAKRGDGRLAFFANPDNGSCSPSKPPTPRRT